MARIGGYLERFAWLLLLLAAVIGVVMSVTVFLAVMMRYVFLSPWRVTEELVGLMFSATIFLAMPLLFARDSNIRVELVVHRLPARLQGLLRLVSDVLTVAFFLILGSITYDFTAFSVAIGARSDVAEIPVSPWMAIMPLVCFLTALIVALKPFTGRRRGEVKPAASV